MFLQEEMSVHVQYASVDILSGSPMTQRYQNLPVTQILGMSLYPPSQRRTVREQRDMSGSIKTQARVGKLQCQRFVKCRCLVCTQKQQQNQLKNSIGIIIPISIVFLIQVVEQRFLRMRLTNNTPCLPVSEALLRNPFTSKFTKRTA